MAEDGAFSHKMKYVKTLEEILNLKGHLNLIIGLIVTAVFLNGWILSIGGASAVEDLQSLGLHWFHKVYF